MSRQTRYPKEVRERAVHLVFEHEREYDFQWAAISSAPTNRRRAGALTATQSEAAAGERWNHVSLCEPIRDLARAAKATP